MDLYTLIQRAKEKDPQVFDIIYRTYYPIMVGICMKIVKEDRAIVDDLVHDAFVLAFVSIGNLRDNTKFNEWLTTIVRNVALKHVSQEEKGRIVPMSSVSEDDAVFVDASASPESDLSYKELLELISNLPEGYSKVLRLSVIEGFSHKEIADMLGIEPHSSSSQLSRAKRLLRRMLDNRIVGVAAVLLLPLVWYLIFQYGLKIGTRELVVDNDGDGPMKHELADSIIKNDEDSEEIPLVVPPMPAIRKRVLADKKEDSGSGSESDSVVVSLEADVRNCSIVAESADDSLDAGVKDSLVGAVVHPKHYVAEGFGKKDNRRDKRWQFLVSGSIGQTLAQNDYRLLAIDTSVLPEMDSSHELPDHVSTWEDYYDYLELVPQTEYSPETLALMEIAKHNTGEIEQREYHDVPLSFSMLFRKAITRKWSLETGLQYSMLKSKFTMGANGYSVVDEQRIHYLGVPLKMSYNWIDYRHLSVYSSFGVTMQIPVYGEIDSNYLVDGESSYSVGRRFSPLTQWQMGASFGLQYRFTPKAGIFIEPTMNWFIPPGSDTRTIWTEKPFMFTCPFGIRITW